MYVDDYTYEWLKASEILFAAEIEEEFQIGQKADGVFRFIGSEVSQE